MSSVYLNGLHFKEALKLAVGKLSEKRIRLNQINVFPVPDGDTGNNMLSTFESAYQAVEQMETTSLNRMAQAAYRGARGGSTGNSGAIFAQYLRGWAQAFEHVEKAGASHMKDALSLGAKYAYEAVQKPKEGTILTVAREASEVHNAGRAASLETILAATYRQARKSLKNTRTILPELKDQNVIDAGGWGLLIFFSAVLGAVDVPLGHKEYDFRPTMNYFETKIDFAFDQPYDMEFVVVGAQTLEPSLRGALDALGTELIIQSNGIDAHVHIHTDDPMRVIETASNIGRIDDCVIRNMHSQHLALLGKDVHRLPYAVVVLAHHPGFIAMSVLAGAETAMTLGNHAQKRHILQEYASRDMLLIAAERVESEYLKNAIIIGCEARMLAAIVSTYAMEKPSERAIKDAAARPRIAHIRLKESAYEVALDKQTLHKATAEESVLAALAALRPEIGDVLTMYFGNVTDKAALERLALDIQDAYPGLEQVDCFFAGLNGEMILSLE